MLLLPGFWDSLFLKFSDFTRIWGCVHFYWFFMTFFWYMGSPLQPPDWDLFLFQESFHFLYLWVSSLCSVLVFRTSSFTYVGFILSGFLSLKCYHLFPFIVYALWYFSGLCYLWLTLLSAMLILLLLQM